MRETVGVTHMNDFPGGIDIPEDQMSVEAVDGQVYTQRIEEGLMRQLEDWRDVYRAEHPTHLPFVKIGVVQREKVSNRVFVTLYFYNWGSMVLQKQVELNEDPYIDFPTLSNEFSSRLAQMESITPETVRTRALNT